MIEKLLEGIFEELKQIKVHLAAQEAPAPAAPNAVPPAIQAENTIHAVKLVPCFTGPRFTQSAARAEAQAQAGVTQTEGTVPTSSVVEGVPETVANRAACGNALINLATSKSRDAAVAVLTKFGAQQLKDVKEADYPAFHAAILEASK